MNTKEFLTNRLSEVKIELGKLKTELVFLEKTLSDYPETEISSLEITDHKDVEGKPNKDIYNGTWIENILTVIKNKNRFLHNSEIANELYSSYKDKDKNSVKRRISAVLSNALSKGDIESLVNYRFTNSIKDTVWGKKEWLDEQGKIKKENMFTSKDKDKNNKTFDF